jgi:hypothetical protein
MDIGGVSALVIRAMVGIDFACSVEDDVAQDPAHAVFIISKNSYNTKPKVILHFSTLSPFWLKPTVVRVAHSKGLGKYHIGRGLSTS